MVYRVENREFAAGDRVRMGSGETGKITSKEERNGITGYRVEVTDGPRKGSTVGASPAGMVKLGRRGADTRVAVALANRKYLCKVAMTARQHQVGLQNTPVLGPDEGMLFLFDPPRAAAFHMGSVPYPIDILFINHGKVAKVVHRAEPGSQARWAHARCEAVLELAAGQASAAMGMHIRMADAPPGGRYPAPPIDGKPGERYEISFPNELDETGHDPSERYKERGTPDEVSPDADQMSNKHWEQSFGYDPLTEQEHGLRPTAQRISDPADFVVGLIEAMARHERPLDWHRDALNPKLAYAVVTPEDVSDWLNNYDMTGSAATDLQAVATSKHGLRVLGDGLVLAGVADTSHVAQGSSDEDLLVLWTEHKDVTNVGQP